MFRKLFRHKSQNACGADGLHVAPGERIYAIGDIHGRADLLDALLEKISADIAQAGTGRVPRIIFVGDYIDRGDHSREVLETLSDMAGARDKILEQLNIRIDFLEGNHERAMLDFIENPLAGKAWLGWGGLQTLASFGLAPGAGHLGDTDLMRLRDRLAAEVQPYMAFLTGLSPHLVSGRVVFVHASLDPESPLDEQPARATLWGDVPSGRKPGLGGYRMVHGHFAGYEPVSYPDRICIDTGAYFSGRLTAVRLDEGETFLHSDTADLLDYGEPKVKSGV